MRTERPLPVSPLPPRPRLTPLKISALVVGGVTLAVIAGVAWWLISPNFIHATAHDPNPFANVTPTANTPSATQTPTASGPLVLATGTFIDTGSGEHGSGAVSIGRTTEGKYILYLEQLKVTNGPDLHIYLSTTANPSSADQVTTGGIDLGKLRATEGAVNVDLPAEVVVNLKQYQSVVIYCKSFAAIFTVAPLQFSA